MNNDSKTAWIQVMVQAEDLSPAIKEALRPVYDRLKSDAPGTAPAMAMAMICQALAMLRTGDGADPNPYRRAIVAIALQAVESGKWTS